MSHELMVAVAWVCGSLVAVMAGLIVLLWPPRRTGRNAGRRSDGLPAVRPGVVRGVAQAPVGSLRRPGQATVPPRSLAEMPMWGGDRRG